ncbi:helix-turn-helix domain-containing protein [Desulfitobacterium metallireducens]|uniref:helix-turn-helix domain-containing protein n=1 Tax=Desulfitobacterium metallireducens TaxID=142877 RepID=UPI0002313E52|nr:helix-turn-helix transcriptional regulator [Desulfitobacterium metallireducens]
MEYVLQNTDLFDEEIGTKFNEAIKPDIKKFDKDKVYKFTVSFHVNLLKDSRMEDFIIPEPIMSNIDTKEEINQVLSVELNSNIVTREDKMNEVLSVQLKRIERIVNEYGIDADLTIQGDYLGAENIIKIEIAEDPTEPIFTKKGKKIKRIKVNSVIPSLPGTKELVSELYTKRIVEIYCKLFKPFLNDKKFISEILDIEKTNDVILLINAFRQQYGDLWLATSEREEEILNRLKERVLFVLKKYEGQSGIQQDNGLSNHDAKDNPDVINIDDTLEKPRFPNNLRYFRKKLGITQLEIEKQTKLGKNQWKRYESGEREPKISLVNTFVSAYNQIAQEKGVDLIVTPSDLYPE